MTPLKHSTLTKFINFLKIQNRETKYIGYPLPINKGGATVLLKILALAKQKQSRLFIMRTLEGVWHLAIGYVSDNWYLPSTFRVKTQTFSKDEDLEYTPALHIVLNNKQLVIELPICNENKANVQYFNKENISSNKSDEVNNNLSLKELCALLLANNNTETTKNEPNNNLVPSPFTACSTHLKPNFAEFKNILEKFTAKKDPKYLELAKVVCARTYQAKWNNTSINPYHIVETLTQQEINTPPSQHYFFVFTKGQKPTSNTHELTTSKLEIFISYTPETLFTTHNQNLKTEALAGSSLPTKNNALIVDNKNLSENKIVIDSIIEELTPLCTKLTSLPPKIRNLAYISHISTTILGHLKSETSWTKLVNSLFPSPAIAGFPRNKALNFIKEYNSFDRGLFAGIGGFVSQNEACMAVLLRCATITNNSITIYAGAGIMPTSIPAEEWAETAHKMTPIIKNFWPKYAEKLLKQIKTCDEITKNKLSNKSFFYDN